MKYDNHYMISNYFIHFIRYLDDINIHLIISYYESKIESIKGFLGFINVLLIDYGFCIKNVRKSKKINKKIEKDYYYNVDFINHINSYLLR